MSRIPVLTLTISLFLMSLGAGAQIITTIAGDGSMTNGPDGIAATACGIYFPQSIACDEVGNVYTEAGGRLRKIDPGGTINTIAGTGVTGYTGDGGPATAAKITNVHGMVFDASGNMYIANGLIRKITPSGIISTFAGSTTPGYGGDGGPASAAVFNRAFGLAFDDAGNLYVGDMDNNRVRKISASGIVSTVAGTGVAGYSPDGTVATAAEIRQPKLVAADHHGNVYFAEVGNGLVRRIDANTGKISTVAGNGPFPVTTGSLTGVGGPAAAATNLVARGLKVDDIDNVYISTSSSEYVLRIGADGMLSPYAGTGASGFSGDGGPATAAMLKWPSGIWLDDTGNLYIADQYNWRVRKVSTGNHLPSFTVGAAFSFITCEGAGVDVSGALAAADADAGQILSWVLFDAPSHGSATVTYTATSTGTSVMPSGLLYTPAPGYSGADTFRVRIDDGISADFIAIYVTVNPGPNATIVSTDDTVCVGNSIGISPIMAGGVWSTTSPVASVSVTGVVTGIMPGVAIISYSVTNGCGTDVATDTITVVSMADCPLSVVKYSTNTAGLSMWPVPAKQYVSIRIDVPQFQIAKAEILDLSGRVVQLISVQTNVDVLLQTPSIPGVYLLRVTTSSGIFYGRLVALE